VQDREDRVLGARPVPDEPGPACHAPAQRAGDLIGLPGALEHPSRQQLRERLRVVMVGLLLGLRDRLQPPRVDDHHLRDVRTDDPRDRQRVTRGLQRDAIGWLKLLDELLKRPRRGRYSWCAANIAVLPDRDLAEIAVNIQTDAAPLHGRLPSLVIDGYRLEAMGTRH
jgi:hypothetical protein